MSFSAKPRLLIVGYPQTYHLGSMLLAGAKSAGLEVQLSDPSNAYQSNFLLKQFNWRLRSHRPTYLDQYSFKLVEECKVYQPHIVLVTGITPPNSVTIKTLKAMGIICLNYLTDDPWNKNHRTHWFLEALSHYTCVFTPRQSNIADLTALGCVTRYLPFAYDPHLHYPDKPPADKQSQFECDLLFYGGADADRVPYIEALLDSGFDVHLYGGYWGKRSKTRSSAKGIADIQTLRWSVSQAKITICFVRRANRDGHSMRTFEAAAMGACMLVEDTDEHRKIFGDEGENVFYFETQNSLIEKSRYLLAQPELRQKLATNVYNHITKMSNMYKDRLANLIESGN